MASDFIARVQARRSGFLRRHRVGLALVLLAGIADTASTIRFMRVEGPEAETHPAVRIVAHGLGPVAGPIIGKIAQVAALVVLALVFPKWAGVLFLLTALLYAFAAAYNYTDGLGGWGL